MAEKKPGLAIILGMGKSSKASKESEEEDVEEKDTDSKQEQLDTCEDILEAVKKEDAELLKLALTRFIELAISE